MSTELSAVEKIKAAMAARNAGAAPATSAEAPASTEVVAERAEATAPAPEPTGTLVASFTGELTDDDATNLALTLGTGKAPTTSLAELADVDGGTSVRHSLPFVQLKAGGWSVYDKLPAEVKENLPASNRPARAVFLGIRLGLTGWAGGSSSTGKGGPPMWAAVVPTPLVHQSSGELVVKSMKIGHKIQFTKRAERAKYDVVGRLTPEAHILAWSQLAGFFILVVPGYKSTRLTLDAFKDVEGNAGFPVLIEVDKETQHNEKATDPEAREWESAYAKAKLVTDQRQLELAQEFEALKARDAVGVGRMMMKFHRGADYDGLQLPELVRKLASYDGLI